MSLARAQDRPIDRCWPGADEPPDPCYSVGMSSLGLPEPYAAIDSQLDAVDLDAAKAALSAADDDEIYAMLQVKLAVLYGAMPPAQALQRLVELMRKRPDMPGANQLYKEMSANAYNGGSSSLSHSHPPPSVKER